jgi:hypothetical protein
VFASDINDLPEPEKSEVPFMKVDVTSWKEQLDLFKAAQEKYGVIHHAFVNAGQSSIILHGLPVSYHDQESAQLSICWRTTKTRMGTCFRRR